ncbi:MAG: xanthomonadin biosynthesis acyl carrier protein XanC [Nevskia sp.]
MTAAELELAQVLIEALNLEGKDAASIDPEAPLFGDYGTGWGLDSIDALEIALAIQQRYGVELRAEDETSRKAFASLRELAVFVAQRRTVAAAP